MPPRIPPDAAPLAGLGLSLVGPGRVGRSLSAWAVARGARLDAVAGRAELGSLDSSGSDLLLLAVPDGALAEVAETLARRPLAPVALHTSGALGASVLAPLERAGAAVGSFHPLKAFPRPLPDPAAAVGTFFALDGAPRARELGARLAAAFGGTAGAVPEEVRDLYHLAASVAAGGVATLVASAGDLARGLGLPPAVARGYVELARGALAELARAAAWEDPPRLERAITGPLARGDFDTFLRELGTLAAAGPPAARRLPLLSRLAVETVRLTAGGEEAARLAEILARRGFLDPPGDGC
jgi:predicted short-subunit dehydrogenase-like oxidoreductase (DUF2520 family)